MWDKREGVNVGEGCLDFVRLFIFLFGFWGIVEVWILGEKGVGLLIGG